MSMRVRFSLLAVAFVAACSASKSADEAPPGDAGAPEARAPVKPPLVDDDAGGPEALVSPPLLSQTGLYADIATRKLAGGLVAFAPRWSFWVDGAEKDRHL